jgi:hypothetical protein
MGIQPLRTCMTRVRGGCFFCLRARVLAWHAVRGVDGHPILVQREGPTDSDAMLGATTLDRIAGVQVPVTSIAWPHLTHYAGGTYAND